MAGCAWTRTVAGVSPAARLIGTPRKRTNSTGGVRWISSRTLKRGRATRSDRKSPAQRRPAGVAGCRGNGKPQRCCGCCGGEDLETVSRGLGVTAATLSGWRDAFLAAGEAALATKSATGEELESDRLKTKLGAALIERDLLHEKIAVLEANRPLARRTFRP